MKINLRKANAIQEAVKSAMAKSSREVIGEVQVNEFQYPEKEIQAALEKCQKAAETREFLRLVLCEMRKKVARANVDSGVSDLLADLNMLKMRIQWHEEFLMETREMLDPAVMQGKLDKLKESENNYGPSSIVTGIYDSDELREFEKTLNQDRKQRQQIQDQLLELNIKTEIELTEDSVELLKDLDIL